MMTTDGSNEFGEFEDDFKTAEKADARSSAQLIPEGVYKVACSQQDITGNGVLVDHEVFKANSGTKGFKLFLEIIEPAEVPDPSRGSEMVKTKGEIIEHVFWVTQKNMGYLKRDIETILGRPLKALSELTTITWVGKTCEIGLQHKTRKGFKNNDVSYINEWKPEKGGVNKASRASAAAAQEPAAAAPAKAEEPAEDPDF